MRPTALLFLVAAVVACKEGEATRVCGVLEERITECSGAGELPRGALESAKEYCRVAMQYERGDEEPGNLAELARDALAECSAVSECGAFEACLDRNGCAFFLSDPTDKTPSFSCR